MDTLADLKLQLRNVRAARALLMLLALGALVLTIAEPSIASSVSLIALSAGAIGYSVRMHQLEDKIEKTGR